MVGADVTMPAPVSHSHFTPQPFLCRMPNKCAGGYLSARLCKPGVGQIREPVVPQNVSVAPQLVDYLLRVVIHFTAPICPRRITVSSVDSADVPSGSCAKGSCI